MELEITTTGLKAFEGVASAALKYYMPSALCLVFGGTNTAYAIQNTSLTTNRMSLLPTPITLAQHLQRPKTIGPGAKASFTACDVMNDGTYGAAVVESDSEPVVAIGKAYGAGLTTAFNGVNVGYQVIGLPYVRWATTADLYSWIKATHLYHHPECRC